MENQNLEQQIEAVLFWKNEPFSVAKLASILNAEKVEIEASIENLKKTLEGRGIVVLEKDGEVTLGTAPLHSNLIEELRKEEINKDLSKSSLETLSIILYKNGSTRAEIDYIRGVNSSFTLRALSVRGLIERVSDPDDSRRYLYKPTLELFSFLGIQNINELPEYDNIETNLDSAVVDLNNSLKES